MRRSRYIPLPVRFLPLLLLLSTIVRLEAAVVVNEIHYHPKSRSHTTEFIELFNPDAAPANLSGWKLDGGVKFDFPPGTLIPAGGYLVIAEDPAELKKEFGQVALGPWKKHLGNNGDKITIRDARNAVVDEVNYGVGFPWPTSADGGGSSLELLNPVMEHQAGSSWRSSNGKPTPGAKNSVFTAQAPPSISAIGHANPQPRSGEQVRVAARVQAPGGIKSVTLLYQVVAPGHYIRKSDPDYEKSWASLPMHDDGKEGDKVAGDGVFLAVVPAEVQKNRTLIRYRIVAEDNSGQSTRVPYADDAAPNFAYFVYDGPAAWAASPEPGKAPPLTFAPNFLATLPGLTLLAEKSDVEHSQWDGSWNKRKIPGTLIAHGQVYDHILFHNRGQASTYNTGKNKWGFHFARGHEFLAHDLWGRPFAKTWNSITMNACASPWVNSNRGMAGLDEASAFRAYELAGIPASRTVPTPFRVIATETETDPKNQFQGDNWGLYLIIEDPDSAFLDERDLPNGNIYRAAGGGDKKHQGKGQPTNNSDYDEFMRKSREQQTAEWWRAHLDLPAFYSFRAINYLVGNVDLREGENHYLYHRPDDHWVVMPWDLDMIFIPRTHQSGRVDQDRCLQIPALRIEYQNRCRELLDLLASDPTPFGGQFGQLVDEYAAAIQPAGFPVSWAQFDMCRWNFAPRTGDKGGFYRNPMRGGPDGNYERKLATPDFNGFVRYVTEFATPPQPPPEKPWRQNEGEPRGYGYGNLASEAADSEAPARPTIRYAGTPTYLATGLRFQCSPYSGKNPFAAVQWRMAVLSPPNQPPHQPRLYETNAVWQSPELTVFNDSIQPPPKAVAPGQIVRARVRMKDQTGRWSRWSEPLQFTTFGQPVPAAKLNK